MIAIVLSLSILIVKHMETLLFLLNYIHLD